MPAPIALFVYNRPEHTRRVLASLRANPEARESDLFVFSDGPGNTAAESAVAAVRTVLQGIEGFRTVTIRPRGENAGLAASVIGGVGELCRSHGRVIVLEDDLLLSPHFLRYMSAALDRYADRPEVMQVAGNMFPVALETTDDALFLPFVSSWGWATWDRAWRLFDPKMGGYQRLAAERQLRRRFNLDGAYDYFGMLRRQISGEIDSWAIGWNLSVFQAGGLVLYPRQCLVENRGFDGSGIHCPDQEDRLSGTLDSTFDVVHFPPPSLDLANYTRVKNFLARQLGWRQRLKMYLSDWFPR